MKNCGKRNCLRRWKPCDFRKGPTSWPRGAVFRWTHVLWRLAIALEYTPSGVGEEWKLFFNVKENFILHCSRNISGGGSIQGDSTVICQYYVSPIPWPIVTSGFFMTDRSANRSQLIHSSRLAYFRNFSSQYSLIRPNTSHVFGSIDSLSAWNECANRPRIGEVCHFYHKNSWKNRTWFRSQLAAGSRSRRRRGWIQVSNDFGDNREILQNFSWRKWQTNR